MSTAVLTSTAAALQGGLLDGLMQPLWSANFRPQNQEFSVSELSITPLALPSASAMLTAWLKGGDAYLPNGIYRPGEVGQLANGLLYHGIWLVPNGIIDATAQQRIDWAGMDVNRQRLASNAAMLWNKTLEYLWAFPSPETVIRARLAGLISGDDFARLMRRAGAKPEQWLAFEPLISNHLSIQEIVTARYRGLLDPIDADKLLSFQGLGDPTEREIQIALGEQIPGPSDLVRFALREGWDQQVVNRFGYDSEWGSPSTFPFQYWMSLQGAGGNADIPGVTGGLTWPQLYWRAHWQAISPTQAYTFLHRFRADNANRRPQGFENLPTFTSTDVNTVLKIADYAPGFRDYLAAASYRVLGRVDVRRMYSTGTLSAQDLPGRYMDQGHSAGDAALLADFTQRLDEQTKLTPLRVGVKSAILASYKTGTIDNRTAARLIYRTTLRNRKDIQNYDSLSEPEQYGIAASDSEIKVLLASQDANVEQSISKQSIGAIRKAYLRLELDANAATLTLRSLGIAEPRIQQYLRLWQYQFLGRGKTLAAAQILRYVVRGALLPTVALDRLVKLGYSLEDAILMLDVAQQDIALAQAKAAAKAAKDAETAKRAQERVVQEQQRALRQAQADLARHGSPKELAEWLARELVSQDEYDLRLNTLGWPEADRQRLAAKAFGASKKAVFNEQDLDAIQRGISIPQP